jgi:hypothetical protein
LALSTGLGERGAGGFNGPLAFAAFKARADEIGEINDAELTAICVATQPREREHAAA